MAAQAAAAQRETAGLSGETDERDETGARAPPDQRGS